MADTGIRGIVITLVVLSLFVICIYNFGVEFMDANNGTSNFVDSDKLNIDSISEETRNMEQTSEDWKETFTSESTFVQSGVLFMSTMWQVAKLMFSSIITFLNLYFSIAYNVLGIPYVVTGVLLTVIIIILIFSIWRTFKVGDSG